MAVGKGSHLFTEENLAECYRSLDGRKAVGADGVTKKRYVYISLLDH